MLQVSAGSEGRKTTTELTSQCPYYGSSSMHPYKQATAWSQVTRAQIREQVISLGFMVSARPWCLCVCRLLKVNLPATGAAPTLGKKAVPVQQGAAMLWKSARAKFITVFKLVERRSLSSIPDWLLFSKHWKVYQYFISLFICHYAYDRNWILFIKRWKVYQYFISSFMPFCMW